MERRHFLKTAGLGMAALGIGEPAAAETKSQRGPNVLLYVVDDLGTDDAGCYGNPVIKTPGLDALAEKGTRFTRSFCTTARCSASRSVLLTGMYNHANGQYGHQHGYNHFVSFPGVRSLPVMLAESGYRTMCAGKYHVAPEPVYHFEQYLKNAPPAKMAEQCRDFITNDAEQPFFLYFCTTEPHRPFHREGSEHVSSEDVIVPPYLPDIPECREELAKYYMSAQRGDSGLRRLIEMLKETGRWDNTLVLFVSDNGIAFPGAKTTLYEPGMRLPCVVKRPGQAGGSVTDAMITWADIAPTILDFAGAVPAEPEYHGRSFRNAMAEEEPDGWDEIYASHTFHEITMYYPMRVVRGGRFKLIWNIAHGLDYPFASDLWAAETWQAVMKRGMTHYGKRRVDAYLHRPRFELYDLEKDPDEVVNLAGEPGHAAVLEELQAKLKAFQKRTGDPWILKWDYE